MGFYTVYAACLHVDMKKEAVKRDSQELVKETIFEADQNISLLCETFMVAAAILTAGATVHSHCL